MTAPDNSFYAVLVGPHNICNVWFVKELDVFICDDLKFLYHISCISGSASLCTYQILCSFSTKNLCYEFCLVLLCVASDLSLCNVVAYTYYFSFSVVAMVVQFLYSPTQFVSNFFYLYTTFL